MRRNLRRGSLWDDSYDAEEDADPRVGLVNLADVMLVFACGLMIALVSHWNVNLSEVASLDEAAMSEVDDVEEMVSDMTSGTSAYSEKGRVFQDPETGKLYLLEEVDSEEDEANTQGEKANPDSEAENVD